MLPGRSILWKYLLLFNAPLATPSSQPPITLLRRFREKYVDLVKQQLRAPDGSFEDWVEIPGVDTQTLPRQSSTDNLVSVTEPCFSPGALNKLQWHNTVAEQSAQPRGRFWLERLVRRR